MPGARVALGPARARAGGAPRDPPPRAPRRALGRVLRARRRQGRRPAGGGAVHLRDGRGQPAPRGGRGRPRPRAAAGADRRPPAGAARDRRQPGRRPGQAVRRRGPSVLRGRRAGRDRGGAGRSRRRQVLAVAGQPRVGGRDGPAGGAGPPEPRLRRAAAARAARRSARAWAARRRAMDAGGAAEPPPGARQPARAAGGRLGREPAASGGGRVRRGRRLAGAGRPAVGGAAGTGGDLHLRHPAARGGVRRRPPAGPGRPDRGRADQQGPHRMARRRRAPDRDRPRGRLARPGPHRDTAPGGRPLRPARSGRGRALRRARRRRGGAPRAGGEDAAGAGVDAAVAGGGRGGAAGDRRAAGRDRGAIRGPGGARPGGRAAGGGHAGGRVEHAGPRRRRVRGPPRGPAPAGQPGCQRHRRAGRHRPRRRGVQWRADGGAARRPRVPARRHQRARRGAPLPRRRVGGLRQRRRRDLLVPAAGAPARALFRVAVRHAARARPGRARRRGPRCCWCRATATPTWRGTGR